MTIVGFDFGTTNSLVAVPVGDHAIPLLDDENRPTPSVVAYEGEAVIVGREARTRLDEPGIGVHDNIVRSPKFSLGRPTIDVGGVARDPIDVVAEVIRHVREQALQSRVDIDLGGLRRAVATIPVTMDGRQRRALREGFLRAGVEITQFVHEPFAALYAHLRSQPDREAALRQREGNRILVVDWGGGTLDLTLCSLEGSQLIQLRNGGDSQIGGDHLDTRILEAALETAKLDPLEAFVSPAARRRALAACERAKIALSEAEESQLFVPDVLAGDDPDLYVPLTRQWLAEVTEQPVVAGRRRVEELLEGLDLTSAQVDECLLTGGMVNMPTIRNQFDELFGTRRVRVADDPATLIARGAAWIALDENPLVLATDVELTLARQAYLELFACGEAMPRSGQQIPREHELFCADPRDGAAKFAFCTPHRPGRNVPRSEPRRMLEHLTVRVDDRAEPFRERIVLSSAMTEDLILRVSARSSNVGDHSEAEINDLEFSLPLGNRTGPPEGSAGTYDHRNTHRPGEVTVRSNLAREADDHLVPGDLLYELRPGVFNRSARNPVLPIQDEERLYYQPCALCGLRSNDPSCRCASRSDPFARRHAG